MTSRPTCGWCFWHEVRTTVTAFSVPLCCSAPATLATTHTTAADSTALPYDCCRGGPLALPTAALPLLEGPTFHLTIAGVARCAMPVLRCTLSLALRAARVVCCCCPCSRRPLRVPRATAAAAAAAAAAAVRECRCMAEPLRRLSRQLNKCFTNNLLLVIQCRHHNIPIVVRC